MTDPPRPADTPEQAFLRQSGVPDAGTPERAAWDLVVAWAQEDREGERPLLIGRVIHDHYPKLIARVAAREAEIARLRAVLEGLVWYRLGDQRFCDYCGHEEGRGRADCVCAALLDAGGAGPGRATPTEDG